MTKPDPLEFTPPLFTLPDLNTESSLVQLGLQPQRYGLSSGSNNLLLGFTYKRSKTTVFGISCSLCALSSGHFPSSSLITTDPLPAPVFKGRWEAVWAEGYLLCFHNLILASVENDPLWGHTSRNAHALWDSWQDVSQERIIPFPTRNTFRSANQPHSLRLQLWVWQQEWAKDESLVQVGWVVAHRYDMPDNIAPLKVSLPYAIVSVLIHGLRFSRRCYHT